MTEKHSIWHRSTVNDHETAVLHRYSQQITTVNHYTLCTADWKEPDNQKSQYSIPTQKYHSMPASLVATS